MRFAVAQLGARRNYAVPRALWRSARLTRLFTDIASTKGWLSPLRHIPTRLQPDGIRRLLGRAPAGIPADRITAFTRLGLEYALRLRLARSERETAEIFAWMGRAFGSAVVTAGLGDADAVFGFNTAAVELLRAARAGGLFGVVEQTIAARVIELRILDEERRAFPMWNRERGHSSDSDPLIAREAEEWEHADLIVCGSEFVRAGLIECGVPPARCRVAVYGGPFAGVDRGRGKHPGPLRVLTVGTVGLRKGTPYVLEAARHLKGEAVFRLLGPLTVPREVVRELAGSVELVGAVPRAEVQAHYAWGDVFLLPSLCEGSAVAVFEAMAAGLPVICTPNTGSVVRNSVEGMIVPPRDSNAIVEALARFLERPELVGEMGVRAQLTARDYSTEVCEANLLAVIRAGDFQ